MVGSSICLNSVLMRLPAAGKPALAWAAGQSPWSWPGSPACQAACQSRPAPWSTLEVSQPRRAVQGPEGAAGMRRMGHACGHGLGHPTGPVQGSPG